MSTPKITRWIDLLAALLGHQRAVTFEEIALEVPGYSGKAKDTAKRQFERDKTELKAFGVPIESESDEGELDFRYRLRTADFYLPYLSVTTPRGKSTPSKIDRFGYRSLKSLTFDADELRAVAEGAARAQQLGSAPLTADATSAMRKLAFDLPVDAVSATDDTVLVPSRAPSERKTLEALGDAAAGRGHAKRLRHMSETVAQQLNRILLLIPKIADGDSYPIERIAEQLGVTRKTLRDDVISLGERFDEPGGFVAGLRLEWDDKQVSAFTEYFLRPMRLSMRELCALELGLALLRRERTPEEWPAIDRALERLREAISRLPANRSGSAIVSSLRTVCPYSLVFAQGMWYMVAFCQNSEALRFFRLDRIEAVKETGDTFEIPGDYSVDAIIAENRLFKAERAETMVVRYSPRIARWIAEREGKPVANDGSLTLEHPLADDQWAMRHVLQYGPEAEVLAPESLRRTGVLPWRRRCRGPTRASRSATSSWISRAERCAFAAAPT
jgi:predicted DNA-binding transcriptional regulator YafY